MIFTYDEIPVECPACGAKGSPGEVSMHIRWSNRHGACVRVFCNRCGQWTDRTRTDKNGLTDRVIEHDIPGGGFQRYLNDGGIPWHGRIPF